MDNAVWCKSQELTIPSNIGFEFIPPYTPEMNPIEQVWAEIQKRGFKNKVIPSLEAVFDQLQAIIRSLHWEDLKREWDRTIFAKKMFVVPPPHS